MTDPGSTVEIRPLTDTDRDAAAAVIRDAFGDEGATIVDLWADVVARDLVRAELVAVDGDEVVGHVGLSHAWLDTRSELVDIVVLSPLSVSPARHGSGIGRQLLAAAVEAAGQLHAPVVVLEGDPGYYGKHGWQPAATYGIEAPSQRIPRPAFQVVALPEHEPWMTGRVVYRDVWWEHDATGLRDPLLAQVEMSLPD